MKVGHSFNDIGKVTIACAAAGTSFTGTFSTDKGFLTCMTVVTPNFTNNVTTTVTITDANSNVVYVSSALARDTTTAINNALGALPLVSGTVTITLTLSGVAGGTGGSVTVKPWVTV